MGRRMAEQFDTAAPTEQWAAPSRLDLGLTALLSVVAGLAAALPSSTPTGNDLLDVALPVLGVVIVTAIGSRARWWALVLAALAATAIAGDITLVVLASAAAALPLILRIARRPSNLIAAASAGVTLNVLLRAERNEFQGFGALVATGCVLILLGTGIPRLSRRWRRTAWIGAGTTIAFLVVAGAGLAYSVLQARSDLIDGVRAAEWGVDALEKDDFSTAADFFTESAALLESAHGSLDQPWARPAAMVPVLAQHRNAVVEMSGAGAGGAATVAEALELIDPSALRVDDGRIDLESLTAMQQPMRDVADALGELQQSALEARSPWLIGKAQYQLDDFDQSIAEHAPSLFDAVEALELAPRMLGADGPRRYLLLFTTPSEARGLGGFIGSYAEMTADDGRLTLTASGSAIDLDQLTAGSDVVAPDEFVERYGRFGYAREGGTVGDAAFRNLTMTPHFPWVGEIAANFYEQTTGRTIDGVIVADPFVIAELLRFTGPVMLESIGQEISYENAVPVLLHDQYVLGDDANEERRESLSEAAVVTFDAMMAGALPDPIELTEYFGPLVDERRLLFWSTHADEAALLARHGMNGAMPELNGGDGWAFTVSNAGGNKIDYFLERSASYEASTDSSGATHGTLTVGLTNTAPTEGEPRYVIGGGRLPAGTNRSYVSLYSALGLDGITVNGHSVGVTAGVERGWNVYSFFVDIPSGETATIEAQLTRRIDDPSTVVTWVQPLGRPLAAMD